MVIRANKLAWLLALGLFGGCAWAQLKDRDPDWKELDAPPAPAFNKDKLLDVDMPVHVNLRFGVDPSTLTITDDGIVRYVMVATNAAGSINAMYEGIRCHTGEVKIYARYSAAGQWVMLMEPPWLPLSGKQPSKHALAFARQGACVEGATARSPQDIVNRLKGSR